MGTGKTYSTKYLLDSNNNRGAVGQVLSTTSTGIDWVNANTVPGAGLWIESGNDIYNSNSGNVGIGTDSPTVQFHVLGQDATFYSGAATQQMNIGRNALENIVISVSDNTNSITANQNSDDDGPHNFVLDRVFSGTGANDFRIRLGGADQVLVNKDGKVGIGTPSPTRRLEISETGNGNSKEAIFRSIGTNTLGSGSSVSEIVTRQVTGGGVNESAMDIRVRAIGDLFASPNTVMTLEGGGNVGIGTTNPSAKLEITGTTPTAGDTTLNLKLPVGNVTAGVTEMGNILFSSTDESVGGSGSIAKISTIAGNGFDAWIGQGRPTDLAFFTQPIGQTATLVEAMRIDQDGYVGIGTDNPNERLHVKSAERNVVANFESTDVKAYISFKDSVTTNTDTVFLGAEGDNMAFYVGNASSQRMRIDSAGNVGIGATSPAVRLHVQGNDIATRTTTTAESVLRLVRDVSDSSHPSTKDSAVDFMLSRQQTVSNNLPYTRLDFRLAGTTDTSTPSLDVMSLLHNGNVGIGTTDPEKILHLDANGGLPIIQLDKGGDKIFNVGTGTSANDDDNTILQMFDEGIEKIRLFTVGDSYLNGGNVGIGNTGPTEKLHVQGNIEIANNSWIGSLDGNYWQRIRFVDDELTTANAFNFETRNGSGSFINHMTILNSGNVGIGDTLPAVKLQVSTNSPTNNVATLIGDGWVGSDDWHKQGGLLLISGTSQNSTQTGAGIAFQTRTTADNNYWKSSIIMDRDGAIRFTLGGAGTAAGSEDFTILSGGNVGIGTTEPTKNLQIEGAASQILLKSTTAGQNASIQFNANFGADQALRWEMGTNISNPLDFEIFDRLSNSTRFLIESGSGNVGIGLTYPTSKLHVIGQDATFYSGTATQQMDIGRNSGERTEIFIDDNTNKIRAIQDSEAGVDFSFILDRTIVGTDFDAVHNFEIQKDGAAQVLVDKDGNVGIGTTNPTAPLQVVGIAEYTNNTTALAAGLTAGAFYRTGDDLKVVH